MSTDVLQQIQASTPLIDPAFERVVRLAALACGTPMSTLIWVDDTEVRPAATHGLSLHTAPLRSSPHAHVATHPDLVLEVPDLRADARFAASTLATQAPHTRFFAGSAVYDEGHRVRACLAVHDTVRRELTPEALQGLKDVAALASTALICQRRGVALEQLTIIDPLTGLSNHKHFGQSLEVELAHAMRLGEPFTVLRMDLDGFKAVHEGFGHEAGEEVLREVAHRMSQQVRQGDVLARLDGDEFGIVMRHGAKESAQVLAKRIVKAVSAPIVLSTGDEIGVGISIGMAAYSDKAGAVPVLLRQADQALFDAKKQNEKRWKMFVGIR
jgi:diguanylate cyclase (GGDEF)-like protein